MIRELPGGRTCRGIMVYVDPSVAERFARIVEAEGRSNTSVARTFFMVALKAYELGETSFFEEMLQKNLGPVPKRTGRRRRVLVEPRTEPAPDAFPPSPFQAVGPVIHASPSSGATINPREVSRGEYPAEREKSKMSEVVTNNIPSVDPALAADLAELRARRQREQDDLRAQIATANADIEKLRDELGAVFTTIDDRLNLLGTVAKVKSWPDGEKVVKPEADILVDDEGGLTTDKSSKGPKPSKPALGVQPAAPAKRTIRWL